MSTATATWNAPVTDKQVSFITRLVSERTAALGAEGAAALVTTAPQMTKAGASLLIDHLATVPRNPVTHADGGDLGEGYYLQEDTVYKVVRGKIGGNLYAKALHSTERGTASWDYAPGAMRHLAASHRLTLDQAREMGTRLGVCVICGKALTDPESVERGIGPVCAARV